MVNVSSRRYKGIWKSEKPFTSFKITKTLGLAIRQLGNSGQSAETVLLNMYNIISSDPELVRRMKGDKRKIKHDD